MDDASYKDVSGRATFTKSETDQITKILSETIRLFKELSPYLKNFEFTRVYENQLAGHHTRHIIIVK